MADIRRPHEITWLSRASRNPRCCRAVVRRQKNSRSRERFGRRDPQLQDSLEGRRREGRRKEAGVGFEDRPASWAEFVSASKGPQTKRDPETKQPREVRLGIAGFSFCGYCVLEPIDYLAFFGGTIESFALLATRNFRSEEHTSEL